MFDDIMNGPISELVIFVPCVGLGLLVLLDKRPKSDLDSLGTEIGFGEVERQRDATS